MLRGIKQIFGIYETGHEYWVRTDSIKVPYSYTRTKVGHDKWIHKMSYYFKTGEFESPILLHRDFSLADGFSSMKIAHITGLEKVPVYFVD